MCKEDKSFFNCRLSVTFKFWCLTQTYHFGVLAQNRIHVGFHLTNRLLLKNLTVIRSWTHQASSTLFLNYGNKCLFSAKWTLIFLWPKPSEETATNVLCRRVVNGPRASFWIPNPARVRNRKPESGPSRTLIFKPDLCPKAKFTELVNICATTGWWRSNVNMTK